MSGRFALLRGGAVGVTLGRVVAFLGIPDDVPAGVAKRMRRQKVLYDGEHHYDVVLGEQALYTNVGGPEVMLGQIERLIGETGLPSLTLGILPATARVRDLFPVPGFNIYGAGDSTRVHIELASSSVDITEPGELGPVFRILPGSRGLARTSAALSSVTNSPTLGFARAGAPPSR
ncbi:Scr1 family TA system antitoxin-like transcriptional regulator [Streptomyces sp. NPDC003688]